MTAWLMALIAIGLSVGAVVAKKRSVIRVVFTGAALAMLATALAAVVFFAFELREVTLKSVLFAPVIESAVIGALAAAAFKLLGSRLRGVPFVTLVAMCGGLMGALVGALFVGHSEHYSREWAVTILAASWLLVSLAAALHLLPPKNSLQRP
jgi:hypothetical protein